MKATTYTKCTVSILLIIIMSAYAVSASDNAIINIPMNNNAIASIVLTPKSWNFFELFLSSESETALNYFLIDNNGTVNVDVFIKGSNSSGWTINKIAPGTDNFSLKYKLQSGGDWSGIGPSDDAFIPSLAHDESEYFGMQILMPTASTTAVTPQTMTVTFTATAN